MNAVLLERQLIEARIHADALNRTAEQLKALEASLRSEEIDRIIEEIYGTPRILEDFSAGELIIALYDSLSDTEHQISEIISLIDRIDLEEYIEE